MVQGTKERITAHRLFATRRYILSTLPVLYISGRRDFQGTDQFLSDDGYGHLCTRTGALWTPKGYSFDGDDYIKNATADWQSLDSLGTILIWFKTSSAGATQTLFSSNDEGTATSRFLLYNRAASNTLSILQQNAGDTADTVTGSTVITDGVWRLGGLVSNGIAYSISLNGVAEGLTVLTGSNTGDWFADTTLRDNFTIGADIKTTIANYFVGSIGEGLVYSRA